MRSAPGWPLRSAPATLDVVQTGADTCTFTLERQKFRKEDNDFRADLSAALAAVPETEKERRRRMRAGQPLRVTQTHSPTRASPPVAATAHSSSAWAEQVMSRTCDVRVTSLGEHWRGAQRAACASRVLGWLPQRSSRMRIHWGRAVAASILALGCITLAFMPQGAASASGTAPRAAWVLTWSQPKLTGVTSEADITSVSCPSKTFCAAVDDLGQALTFNGTRWSAPVAVGTGGSPLTSVSCPSARFCVAVAEVVDVSYYNGRTWSAPQPPGDFFELLGSVSCTSSTFCVALDDASGSAIRYNGTNWSASVIIDGKVGRSAVSCASSTFCVAVDANGQASTYNGRTWSAPSLIGEALTAVSCPTAKFCAAVDDSGSIVGYNRKTWTVPVTIDGTSSLTSISCKTSEFCVSVDVEGNAIQTRGAATGTVRAIDPEPGDGLGPVSCVTTTFCVAVDQAGDYLVGR